MSRQIKKLRARAKKAEKNRGGKFPKSRDPRNKAAVSSERSDREDKPVRGGERPLRRFRDEAGQGERKERGGRGFGKDSGEQRDRGFGRRRDTDERSDRGFGKRRDSDERGGDRGFGKRRDSISQGDRGERSFGRDRAYSRDRDEPRGRGDRNDRDRGSGERSFGRDSGEQRDRGFGRRRDGEDRNDRGFGKQRDSNERGGDRGFSKRRDSDDRSDRKEKSFGKKRNGGFQPGRGKSQDRDFPRGGRRPVESSGQSTGYDKGLLILRGEVQKNPKGFAFLLQKPEDFFISPNLAQTLVTGDTVKAWINPRNREVIRIQIVQRTLKQFIGTFIDRGQHSVADFKERNNQIEMAVNKRDVPEDVRHNDKVLVEVTNYTPLEARIIRTFGEKLAPKLDTFSVVVRAQWPQEFSREAEAEAAFLSKDIQEKAKSENYKGRIDLREKPFITIDGADARDFDDAICIEKTTTGYILYVAIADVAEFVRPGTKLNDEAYGRATSVYFPEWVIPMLPEVLSNGACSLRPNEEKLTLTCEMHFSEQGEKRSAKVYESVICSKRRCIYEDVQKEFEAGNDFWKIPYELFHKIRKRRFGRGALDLELPEAKIVLDAEGNTIDIKKTDRVDSHKVIEDFMIIANEAVTELMEAQKWPFVYRVHEPPQGEALQRFVKFAMALGLKPNFNEGDSPLKFSQFLDSIKDKPYATTLSYMMLRSLKQARYEPTNLKHFGLASKAYTHFTSPIRRYPDLMVHRLLKMFARHEAMNDQKNEELTEYLEDACDHCSRLERKAESLDRQVTKIKKARFMENYYGHVFEARVSNVTEGGLYVELDQFFVDGLLAIDELGGDYFEFIEQRFMLRGKRSGKKYCIGDQVKVALLRVDIDNGFIDFTLAENLEEEDLENADS